MKNLIYIFITHGGIMKIMKRIILLTFLVFSVNLLASEGEAVSAVGSLSSIKTEVNDENNLPTEYKLEQNHPNPFNPTTTISYAIPEQSFVSLKIYDVTGSEVKELVSESQNAGFYNVAFDASNLSSGLYFYSLISGNFNSTKKMILLK